MRLQGEQNPPPAKTPLRQKTPSGQTPPPPPTKIALLQKSPSGQNPPQIKAPSGKKKTSCQPPFSP